MRRLDEDGYSYTPYVPPRSAPEPVRAPEYGYGGDGQYFSGPTGSGFGTGLDTGLQQTGGSDVRYVSGVGPTRSEQPRGPFDPFMRASAIFGGGGRSVGYKGRAPYQRGFTVAMQERLRRRRKGRLFG
jgi:hypothetical protein